MTSFQASALRARPVFVLITVAAIASAASATDDGDIAVVVEDNGDGTSSIVTGLVTRSGPEPGARIFESDFGDDGVPNLTSEPGFEAEPETFVPDTSVGFHAPQGFLRFTGDGLVLVTTERLNVTYFVVEVDIGPEPSDGFELAVQSNGGWHKHLSFTIWDEANETAPSGIYVLPMTLHSTDPNVLESELFWIVFDYDAGEDAQEAAVAWITDNLLAPSCPQDLDGDGEVGATDMAILLGSWGEAGAADLDGGGAVGAEDLAILLGAWGGGCAS